MNRDNKNSILAIALIGITAIAVILVYIQMVYITNAVSNDADGTSAVEYVYEGVNQ